MNHYPVEALRDLLHGLLTSLDDIMDDSIRLEVPASLRGALLFLADAHPEPDVAHWLRGELEKLT